MPPPELEMATSPDREIYVPPVAPRVEPPPEEPAPRGDVYQAPIFTPGENGGLMPMVPPPPAAPPAGASGPPSARPPPRPLASLRRARGTPRRPLPAPPTGGRGTPSRPRRTRPPAAPPRPAAAAPSPPPARPGPAARRALGR